MTDRRNRGTRIQRVAAGLLLLGVLPACGTTAAGGSDDRAAGRGGPVTTSASSDAAPARCPKEARPVSLGPASPFRVIGRTGPIGITRDRDVSESTLTITNENALAVYAKAIVLLGFGGADNRSVLVEYGVPNQAVLHWDGGLDYGVTTPVEVPPGASVDVAARVLTNPSSTVKALYGGANIRLLDGTMCSFPVPGAEPITLLGGPAAKGCTDPLAAECRTS